MVSITPLYFFIFQNDELSSNNTNPNIIFENVGGNGCKVEFRRSGSDGTNPYVLSFVFTNSNGESNFYSFIDSDGSRLYAYLSEVKQLQNTVNIICDRLGIEL